MITNRLFFFFLEEGGIVSGKARQLCHIFFGEFELWLFFYVNDDKHLVKTHTATSTAAATALLVALHSCTASLVTASLNVTHLPSHGPSHGLGGRCRFHQ